MQAKYNYEVGKLYDTIFYIVTCLFEKEMIERVYTKFSKTADLEYDMRFYTELKGRSPEVPSDLIPFCYCNPQQVSFLLRYFGDNINFDNGTLDNVKELFSNAEKSKKYFINIYFPKLSDEDRQKLFSSNDINFMNSAIIKSEIEEKYQSTFLAFLMTYETRLPLLINTVENIYYHVKNLHDNNKEFIQSIINKLNDSDLNTKEKLFHYFALTEEKQIIFMFSLLNPLGVHYWKKPYNYPFRVGEKFIETLSFESEYNHITFESFAKIHLSPARSEIYNMFLKYKSLNAGDIIDATKLSRYTVYTYLNDMLAEKAIIYINSTRSTLYYTLNENYLLKYIEFITEKAINYINLKRKEKLKHYVRPRKKRKDAQD